MRRASSHRRDGGYDQDGPASRPLTAWRASRCERCRTATWKTLTLVAALRINGLTAPYVIDGAMGWAIVPRLC